MKLSKGPLLTIWFVGAFIGVVFGDLGAATGPPALIEDEPTFLDPPVTPDQPRSSAGGGEEPEAGAESSSQLPAQGEGEASVDGSSPKRHRWPQSTNLTDPVNVTVTTSPPNLQIVVDGVVVTAPQVYLWENGSDHHIVAVDPQVNGEVRQVFSAWSDGGSNDRWVHLGGVAEFLAIFSTEYRASFTTSPENLGVTIDDIDYSTPVSFWWPAGSRHLVNSGKEVFPGVGTRALGSVWSDEGTQSHYVYALGPMALTAYYRYEHLLTFETAFGKAACDSYYQWYEAGTNATCFITEWPVDVAGTRHLFGGWSLEPEGTLIQGTILMDGPKNISALWTTEHFLMLQTRYGTGLGGGWHAQGQSVAVGLDATEVTMGGERHVFSGWQGDATSTSSGVLLTMDAPKSLQATWAAQYYLDVRTAYGLSSGSGWYAAGESAVASLDSTVVSAGGTRWIFWMWTGDSASATPKLLFTMDGPHEAIATWVTEHYVAVETGHGEVSGGGWYVEGSLAAISINTTEVADSSGTWRFVGWEGDHASTSTQIFILVSGPKTVTARWELVPPLPPPPRGIDGRLAAAAAAAGVVAAAIVVVATPRGQYALGTLAAPLFTRLKREDVRSQFNRGRLIQFIDDHPGANYSEIRRRLHLSNGGCAYHLGVLERNGEIQRVAQRATVRFYAAGYKFDAEALPPLSFVQRRVLEVLVDLGSAGFGEIQAELEKRGHPVGDGNLSHHLKALRRDKELISMRREDRKAIYFMEEGQRRHIATRLQQESGVDEVLERATFGPAVPGTSPEGTPAEAASQGEAVGPAPNR